MATTTREPLNTAQGPALDSSHRVNVDLRLQATEQSSQPVFSNFTSVQSAPGMVFIDFGFLDPGALPGLARIAQAGGKMPETINGRLACRVVLGAEAAAQLAQQLAQQARPVPQQATSKPS